VLIQRKAIPQRCPTFCQALAKGKASEQATTLANVDRFMFHNRHVRLSDANESYLLTYLLTYLLIYLLTYPYASHHSLRIRIVEYTGNISELHHFVEGWLNAK